MGSLAENPVKLHADLLVGNPGSPGSLVILAISQIPQMDEERQHIVFTLEGLKIIFKTFGINLYHFTADKPGNIILQTILIYINISQKGFRRRRFFQYDLNFPLCMALIME